VHDCPCLYELMSEYWFQLNDKFDSLTLVEINLYRMYHFGQFGLSKALRTYEYSFFFIKKHVRVPRWTIG